MAERKSIYELIEKKLETGITITIKLDDEQENYILENNEMKIDVKDVWAIKAGKTSKLFLETEEELGYKEELGEDFSKTIGRGIVGTFEIGRYDEMIFNTGTHRIKFGILLEKMKEKEVRLKIEDCNPEDVKKDEEEIKDEEFEEF